VEATQGDQRWRCLMFSSNTVTDVTHTVVLVRERRVPEYIHYIENALDRGFSMVQLFAQGNLWIAKSHRITEKLVNNGSVNVFECEVGKVSGDPNCPFIVITLVTSAKLPKTSKRVWDPSFIKVWAQKAQESHEAQENH